MLLIWVFSVEIWPCKSLIGGLQTADFGLNQALDRIAVLGELSENPPRPDVVDPM